MKTKQCSCGAQIIFVETGAKNPMPCEAKITLVYTKVGNQVRGHEPHWGNCPDAKKHRKGPDGD